MDVSSTQNGADISQPAVALSGLLLAGAIYTGALAKGGLPAEVLGLAAFCCCHLLRRPPYARPTIQGTPADRWRVSADEDSENLGIVR